MANFELIIVITMMTNTLFIELWISC